jgi:hypothetical protein
MNIGIKIVDNPGIGLGFSERENKAATITGHRDGSVGLKRIFRSQLFWLWQCEQHLCWSARLPHS